MKFGIDGDAPHALVGVASFDRVKREGHVVARVMRFVMRQARVQAPPRRG